MKPRFIVGEVSKNWNREDDLPLRRAEYISGKFEEIIEVNLARGYRLHSFDYCQTFHGPDDVNETIVAVFELIDPAEGTS